MKESKLFKKFMATFVVTVLGGPAVVLASTYPFNEIEGPRASVSYADLNLESEESVRVLYRRLQHASREVCSPRSLNIARSDIYVWYATRACSRRTLSNAVDQFHNEDLTRIHAG